MTQNTKSLNPLQSLLDEAAEYSRLSETQFYVFDIDSTLLDVSPRIQKIINDFMQTPEVVENYPEILSQVQFIKIEPTDWGIRHAFERLKIPNVPASFIEKAKSYWREHFFSNIHLPVDQPYEGATEFVQNIHQMGHQIIYLTGRDLPRMGAGTVASLRQHGFPVEIEKTQLVLKPDKTLIDTEFKKNWFEEFIKNNPNRKFLFFENEPMNIQAIRHLHPIVKVIFFESTHSGKLDAPTDLPKIQNFKILT
jgi:hypothetical protein